MVITRLNEINTKLSKWYETAKLDFGIVGSGVARMEGENLVIDYTEDGVQKTWEKSFKYNEQVNFFNVWAEEAQ